MTQSANTAQIVDWLDVAMQHGLISYDARGRPEVPGRVRVVMDALSEVLAGGQVEITVTAQGNPSRKHLLAEAFEGTLIRAKALASVIHPYYP